MTDALSPLLNSEKIQTQALSFAQTIATLRSPGGCPWDQKQTWQSLRPFLIEESYETAQALENAFQNPSQKAAIEDLKGELGDVLLQVFLNAQIAAEEGHFDVADVFAAINEKMIRRHPHVFAHKQNLSTDGVLTQWEEIKNQEKKEALQGNKEVTPESLLKDSLRKNHLPTLTYGCGISKQALKLGFAWPDLKQVFEQLESEIKELKEEVLHEQPSLERITDEMGDVFVTLCNLTVHLGLKKQMEIDLDWAARQGTKKFADRFAKMEKISHGQMGQPLTLLAAKALSLEQWDELWQEVKRQEKLAGPRSS